MQFASQSLDFIIYTLFLLIMGEAEKSIRLYLS